MAEKTHPRVPPLQYLPAGCLSSKQSSIEAEDPVLEASSLALDSQESREISVLEGPNIIVFDKFTPKDGFQTDAISKCFKFPDEHNSRESLRRLVVQLEDSESIGGQGDSLQLSSRGTAVEYSRMLTSEFCSPTDLVLELKAEVEMLRANCARYEEQNQELRHEIHLSTSDLLLLDKSKREAAVETQGLKAQIAAQNEDFQAVQTLLTRLRKLLGPDNPQELEGESVAVRCGIVLSDVEALVMKSTRLKALYEQTAAENRRLMDASSKLNQYEKSLEELQSALVQRDKTISVLEDQVSILRTAASKGSSGRNSSEAGKRPPELVKSASTSFHKTVPSFIHKKNQPAESPGFSSYLIEDEAEDIAKRLGPLERSHPASESLAKPPPSHAKITSISPAPRAGRAVEQRQSLRWTSVNTQSRVPKFISKGLERRLGESTTLRKSQFAKQS